MELNTALKEPVFWKIQAYTLYQKSLLQQASPTLS